VQKINKNYFQLFSIPEIYHLDIDLLGENYRGMQVEMHPDRFVNASEEKKMWSVQRSSLLNQAYDTLKDPLKRAAYMLERQGMNIEQVSQHDLGMDLLMEQMVLRESLDELPKNETALDALSRLKKEVSGKLKSREKSFSSMLLDSEFATAKKIFHEMQFLKKLLLEINQGEEQRLGY
jgi:molecular chaperone HscB|tara:strand:+ start:3085 stop:3618 length:534 start_codon:yes stop_codon:yes gene_type:complete